MTLSFSTQIVRPSRARKLTVRGHGAFSGGTTNDMPPPPEA